MTSLGFHPTDPNIIIAVLSESYDLSIPMLITRDGGSTWDSFGPQPEECTIMGSSIYIDEENPDRMILAASGGDNIVLSTDGGISWQIRMQGSHKTWTNYSYITKSPWENNTLYCNLAVPLVSRDNGYTWQGISILNQWDIELNRTGFVHPVYPDHMIYIQLETGAFFSSNGGQEWQPCLGELTYFSVLPTNGCIIADTLNPGVIYMTGRIGVGDCNANRHDLFKSTDFGASWHKLGDLPGERIGWIYPSIHVPGKVFAIVENEAANEETVLNWLVISTDQGETWEELHIPDEKRLMDITEKPDDPNTWYVLGAKAEETSHFPGVFYRTTDGGITWQTKFKESGFDAWDRGANRSYGGRYGVAKCDPVTPDRLYLAYGGLWRSENGGDNWKEISGLADYRNDYVEKKGLAINPANNREIYFKGYKTTDGGTFWTENKSFPQNMEIDPIDPSIIYDLDYMGKMKIQSGPPVILMSGFGPTNLKSSEESTLGIYAIAADPDPHDSVQRIEILFDGMPLHESRVLPVGMRENSPSV